MHKSKIFDVGVPESEVSRMANRLLCTASSLPITRRKYDASGAVESKVLI